MPAPKGGDGIALSALGEASKKHEHRYDHAFWEFFRQYTNQHFRDGDIRRPYLVEHYNPESGERLSDEVDYNHSYWIDLIVSFVAGVEVQEERIIIDPLHLGLKWFVLTGLDIRGHRYDISWSEGRSRGEVPAGMRVCRDGEEIYRGDSLGKVEVIG